MDADKSVPQRRHTTMLEGLGSSKAWRGSVASFGRKLIIGDPQFDPDKYHEDSTTETRRSKGSSTRGRLALVQNEKKKTPDIGFSTTVNPFDDSNATEIPGGENLLEYTEIVTAPSRQQILEPEEPYHIATIKEKWMIIATISAAGLFSGLSSNIYFPSLDAIAKDLRVTLAAVSLTITSYLIIQGISPVIWGAFSDTLGRRPIYIASFTVYIVANIVLSFTPNFVILVIFRGLQAAGSASTVSIGNGVIQDISPPSERGAFISFYQAIRNFSIAIGPVLGGALAQSFGFRSVFVFLLIMSSLVILDIITFLPETMRSIAGNGTIRVHGIYQPLIRQVRKEPSYMEDSEDVIKRKRITIMTFIDPLKLLKERDIVFNLIFGGAVYAIWSMVTASTTTLFKAPFGLTELLLGVVFLPNGFGTIIGSAIVGKLMTDDYREAEKAYKELHGLPPSYKLPAKNVPKDFPIEHTRLRHLPWISLLFALSTGGYGFSLAFPAAIAMPGWIVVPLIFQFLIAATSNAIFALNQTLVSDLCPGKGASATAVNNLVRCSLGAVGVAVIDVMIANIGPAFTFLGLALIVIFITPLSVVVWYWGPGWRASRTAQKERMELDKEIS